MWTQTEIGSRPAEVFLPAGGVASQALLYLHGYGEERLSENEVFSGLFDKWELPVVAPRGGKCWWLDVISPSFDPVQTPVRYLLDQVIPWIASEWKVTLPHIGLLGVSMGGQGVLNLAYRQALRFPVVAALSPAIDFDLLHGKGYGIEEMFPTAEAARQETVTLHLHPLNWPKHQLFCSDPLDSFWHVGSERLASKLQSSGVPFQSDLLTSSGGHGWPYFNAQAERAVDFVGAALRGSPLPDSGKA